MSEDDHSKEPGAAKRPGRAKLPEKRTRTVLPVPRSTVSHEEKRPAEIVPPMPPMPPRTARGKGSKIVRLLIAVLIPAAVLVTIILMVRALDKPKSGPEKVEGGTLYWMSDGLVGVQEDPGSEKRAYYLVEAPKEADPRITFNDGGMILRVNTDEGMQTIVQGTDWTKAPTVVLFTFKDYFQEAVKLEGDVGIIEEYLKMASPGAPLRGFLHRFRRAEYAEPPPKVPKRP